MSIYIKNMQMPEFGEKIIVLTSSGYVEDLCGQVIDGVEAISIPPHGKLKDADAIERNLLKMQQAQTGPCSHGVRKSRAVLRDAPTIIPEELPKEE